jgi:hypothetical protein
MSALPRTSRAAVLVEYNQPLEIRELTLPPQLVERRRAKGPLGD